MMFGDDVLMAFSKPLATSTRLQTALQAASKTAIVAAPMITVVTGAGSKVLPEVVPLSDPRHPQHAEWLAMQGQDSSSTLGWYIGGAVFLAGAGWFMLRHRGATP